MSYSCEQTNRVIEKLFEFNGLKCVFDQILRFVFSWMIPQNVDILIWSTILKSFEYLIHIITFQKPFKHYYCTEVYRTKSFML